MIHETDDAPIGTRDRSHDIRDFATKLKDIAHNFLSGDRITSELLEKLFILENDKLDSGILSSDFVFLVATKPA